MASSCCEDDDLAKAEEPDGAPVAMASSCCEDERQDRFVANSTVWFNSVVGTTLVGVAFIYGMIYPFVHATGNPMCTNLLAAVCVTLLMQLPVMLCERGLAYCATEATKPSRVQRRKNAVYLLNASFVAATGVAWSNWTGALTSWAAGMNQQYYENSLAAGGTGMTWPEAKWLQANAALAVAVYCSAGLLVGLYLLSCLEGWLLARLQAMGSGCSLLKEYVVRTVKMVTAPFAFVTAFGTPWYKFLKFFIQAVLSNQVFNNQTKADFFPSCSWNGTHWADTGTCWQSFLADLCLAVLCCILCYIFAYRCKLLVRDDDGPVTTNFKQLVNALGLVGLSYSVVGLAFNLCHYTLSKAMDDRDYQSGNAVMYVFAAAMTAFTALLVRFCCDGSFEPKEPFAAHVLEAMAWLVAYGEHPSLVLPAELIVRCITLRKTQIDGTNANHIASNKSGI